MRFLTKARRRYITITVVVFAWLIVGLSIPFFFHSDRIDFEAFGVRASPRNQFNVTAPTILNQQPSITLRRGQITQSSPDDQPLTGQRARELLTSGKANLVLEFADVRLGSSGATTEAFLSDTGGVPQPLAPVLRALSSLHFASLDIRHSDIAFELPSGQVEELFDVNLQVDPIGQSALRVKGRAWWRGHLIDIDLETQPITKSGDPTPLTLAVSGPVLSAKFSGHLSSVQSLLLVGDAEIKIPKVMELLGLPNPFTQEKSKDTAALQGLSLSGPLRWTNAALEFPKVKVKLDDNDANGALAIKNLENTPQIAGTLAFDSINLTRYASLVQAYNLPKSKGWWDLIVSMWPRPFVNKIDADLRVSTQEAELGSARFGKAAATISLKRGKLSAQLAKFDFDQGSGSGQITVDYNSGIPKFTLHGRLQNAPLGDLTSLAHGKRSIEGRATITADVSSRGRHRQEILENLSGQLQLELVDGGSIGLDVNTLIDPSKQAVDVQPSQLIRDAARGTTQLESLNVEFKIKSGHAVCNLAIAEFDGKTMSAVGRLNLPSQALDMQAIVVEGAPGPPQATEAQEKPAEVIVGRSVAIRGPWYAPKIKLSDRRGSAMDLLAELRGRKRIENSVPQ
ncbi:MAG: AsmA family protein [Hyphomicrobiaceae bacterium]